MAVSNERTHYKYDVKHKEVKKGLWIPEDWEFIAYGPGGLPEQSYRARLTEFEELANVDPSTFDIEFPPGTVVRDERADEKHVVRHDGGKRPIEDTDRGATYQQLLASAPGEALVGTKSSWRTLSVIAFVTALIALGLLVWRRKAARAKT